VANVIFSPDGQAFCSGLTTSINLLSNVTGTSFTWTATGSAPSISGYGPGSGNLIQQTLTNTGPYPQRATYHVGPAANGCAGISDSVVVTVNPLPPVTFTPCFDDRVSLNSQPVLLKGGLPLGGNYSGPGVVAGNFFPSLAGTGNHVITYTYTNTWACTSNATATITVVAPLPFACGGNLTDIRDNQVYPTIQIGGQCWMSVNLNYGNIIPSAQMQRDNCIPEKYCYNDNPANCSGLGGMYQWDEMMQYVSVTATKGFCPPEWHVPSEAEWSALFAFYISNGFAGSPLKFTGYSGFNALLSGTRFNNFQWDFSNFAVMFWSSSPHGQFKAWAHGMNDTDPSVSLYPALRSNGFSVRCIKD
jgi:uncharacterized protein (TIGR02145 family)